jgi:hypothetical protein
MSGYVRIHRTLIGHPAFRNDAEAMAFAWLVARAAWKPARVRYKERAVSLDRGQLAVSVRDFANAMDRDKAWIERLLKRLKSETMIETVTEAGVTVITICNYAQYQSDPVLCETPSETPRKTRARQGRDTEQGSEKGKKEIEARKRAVSILAPDWMPTEEWLAFVAMRQRMESKKGVIWSEDAAKGVIAKIDALRAEGHCPTKLLQKAVVSSWRTVFADDDTRAAAAKPRKPMTPDEMRNALRFHQDRGETERCAELSRLLSSIDEKPPDPMAGNVHRLVREVAKSGRA